MAGTPTTNYALPTYADADAPDLTGAYNSAMTKIDTQMKKNADVAASASSAASTASSTASTAKSTADSALSKANANATDIASLEEEVAGLSASSFNPQSTDKKPDRGAAFRSEGYGQRHCVLQVRVVEGSE